MVVDTRARLPGPRSTAPVGALAAVGAAEGVVALNLTQEEVREAPEPPAG